MPVPPVSWVCSRCRAPLDYASDICWCQGRAVDESTVRGMPTADDDEVRRQVTFRLMMQELRARYAPGA